MLRNARETKGPTPPPPAAGSSAGGKGVGPSPRKAFVAEAARHGPAAAGAAHEGVLRVPGDGVLQAVTQSRNRSSTGDHAGGRGSSSMVGGARAGEGRGRGEGGFLEEMMNFWWTFKAGGEAVHRAKLGDDVELGYMMLLEGDKAGRVSGRRRRGWGGEGGR